MWFISVKAGVRLTRLTRSLCPIQAIIRLNPLAPYTLFSLSSFPPFLFLLFGVDAVTVIGGVEKMP